MMRSLLLLFLSLCTCVLHAQLNATLRGQLDYDVNVNDIWGYAAPDGTEYAIVGLTNGVSFVSLADPDDPVEVARIAGDFSQWRDMKTYGEYAYSVADQSNSTEGITAFDLTELPDRVTFTRNTYDIPGETVRMVRAHNLYIDTLDGVLLTAGGTGDLRNGGILMFDLTEDPIAPELIGTGPAIYAHDVFVLQDTMYASELFRGELALYDVSDYANPVEIGRTTTPFTFTHNAWTTADGRYVYTTDERGNAPVAGYDLTNKVDIELTDEYRPISSLNTGTIPHNVHVIDDFLSISYYTDGLRVVDASDPTSLIEVANYDTWSGPNGNFNGAWGAYPYLPSGLTLVSDIQTGLYVVDVDYKRAARLRGIITDRELGFPLNNVSVVINAPQDNIEATDVRGRYATGVADGGSFTVTFSARDYEDLTLDIDLVNGETVRIDTSLAPVSPRFNLGFTVLDDETDAPIDQATISLVGPVNTFGLSTASDGTAGLDAVFDTEDFAVYVTQWGYRTQEITEVSSEDLQDRVIRLEPGFMDDFITDEGWTVTESARTGDWEREEPVATNFSGEPSAPGMDADGDIGNIAYVTGNGGGSAGNDDVDGGTTRLSSPAFGPLADNVASITISYSYWFVNVGGDTPLDDSLSVAVFNGTQEVARNTYTESVGSWIRDSLVLTDRADFDAGLRVVVSAADEGNGHVAEGGFDAFEVTEVRTPVSTDNGATAGADVTLYPNPSSGPVFLNYNVPGAGDLRLRITDVSGKLLRERVLTGQTGTAQIGHDLAAGLYLVEILGASRRWWLGKVVLE